jgi:hypothetical protein
VGLFAGKVVLREGRASFLVEKSGAFIFSSMTAKEDGKISQSDRADRFIDSASRLISRN